LHTPRTLTVPSFLSRPSPRFFPLRFLAHLALLLPTPRPWRRKTVGEESKKKKKNPSPQPRSPPSFSRTTTTWASLSPSLFTGQGGKRAQVVHFASHGGVKHTRSNPVKYPKPLPLPLPLVIATNKQDLQPTQEKEETTKLPLRRPQKPSFPEPTNQTQRTKTPTPNPTL